MKWMRWDFTNTDGSTTTSYSSPENFARFVALYGQPKHKALRPATATETAAEKKRLAAQDAFYVKHGRYPS